MGAQKIKIGGIKPNKDNPRTISRRGLKRLRNSIRTNPTYNELNPLHLNEEMVVLSGNQRLKVYKEEDFKELWCIVVDRKFLKKVNSDRKKQNEKFKGDKSWKILDPITYEQLCDDILIMENTHYGEWDYTMLGSGDWDLSRLADWGLDMPVKDQLGKLNDGDDMEFEKSLQIEPPQEYIMILCEPNSKEWEEMKEKLKLNKVRRGGYKKGSPFDAVGLERVITWKDFKKRYKC